MAGFMRFWVTITTPSSILIAHIVSTRTVLRLTDIGVRLPTRILLRGATSTLSVRPTGR